MPDTQGSRVKSNLGTPSLQLHESDLVRINNAVHAIFIDVFSLPLRAMAAASVTCANVGHEYVVHKFVVTSCNLYAIYVLMVCMPYM